MSFANRNFGKWQSKTIAPEVRDRATKVIALVNRGATDGERAAAQNRLDAIAAKAGVTAETLKAALS